MSTPASSLGLLAVREARGRRRESALWLGAASLAVVAVVAGTLLAPEATAGALFAAVALFASFRWPFAIAYGTLIVLVTSSVLELTLGPTGSMLDEALILLSVTAFTVRRIWIDRSIVLPAGLSWFAAFLAVGCLVSLLQDVPNDIWTQQAFLSVKGFVLAFGFAQLEWNRRALKNLAIGGVVVTAFLLVTAVLNLFFTEAWVDFTKIRTPVTVFGIPELNGPYSQPAALGRITAVIGVASFCYLLVTRSRLIPALVLVVASAISVLTVRVKTLTSMIVVYAFLSLRQRSVWLPLGLLAVLPIAGLTIIPVFADLVSTDLTAYFFGETESARSMLVTGSLEIASREFPLGAGFGRYGSYIAAVEYSPEYVARGWTWHYGLGEAEEWGRYLTDTQWPAFLGETGWLGTLLYAGGLVAMLLSMRKPIGALEPPLYTWIRWSGMGWLVLIAIESIGAPVFTSPPAYAFAFLGAGITASLRHAYRARGMFDVGEYEEAPDALRRAVHEAAGR